MARQQLTLGKSVGRGILAGLAGTVVMTAFQKLLEMPITGRGNSYAPAKLTEKVLGVRPRTDRGRWWLNYATHFSLGIMWGTAFGVASYAGLRGQRAVAAVFSTVYAGDVLLNTALGLYAPRQWSRQDLLVDVVDKLVQAEATGKFLDGMTPRRGATA